MGAALCYHMSYRHPTRQIITNRSLYIYLLSGIGRFDLYGVPDFCYALYRHSSAL